MIKDFSSCSTACHILILTITFKAFTYINIPACPLRKVHIFTCNFKPIMQKYNRLTFVGTPLLPFSLQQSSMGKHGTDVCENSPPGCGTRVPGEYGKCQSSKSTEGGGGGARTRGPSSNAGCSAGHAGETQTHTPSIYMSVSAQLFVADLKAKCVTIIFDRKQCIES